VHECALSRSGTSFERFNRGVKMLGTIDEVALLEVERGLRRMCDSKARILGDHSVEHLKGAGLHQEYGANDIVVMRNRRRISSQLLAIYVKRHARQSTQAVPRRGCRSHRHYAS